MRAMRRRRKSVVDEEKAADPKAVRMAAIALLARRDYASGELREKLTSQGFDRDTVATTLQELADGKFLNDARYAENYVAYHADRGQGPLRISADLKAMGLPDDLIEAALQSGPDWRVLARKVRVRKFGQEPPSDWSEKARQARFLQYRGFSLDHIRSALGPDFDPYE